MGACDFYTNGKGNSAKEAFNAAVDQMQWDRGHGGYTGTIAEKSSFVMITPPSPFSADEKEAAQQAMQLAEQLMADDDKRIEDKWGPAGCIKYASDKYLFFGWASS